MWDKFKYAILNFIEVIKEYRIYHSILPVYVIKDEMDCDCCQWTSSHRFRGGRALNAFVNSTYDNAEGRVSMQIVSKKEYESFEAFTRDHAAEQMNY